MGAAGEPHAMQLIDEQKRFARNEVVSYFDEVRKLRDAADRGVDEPYHIVSVFGSQSSGKSTLLNVLFHTAFDTMDAQLKRQQTTRGIWLAHTNRVTTTADGDDEATSGTRCPDIFVLDVEGSDGSERGEDQDFERKAALFALAVSEVLIVNIWEQQIGLYQGNNMALLKTVFEVNLSLFGTSQRKNKVLLLFVIRDHVGITPLESLSESLTKELKKVWSTLNKPTDCQDISLYDFFDLQFVGLAHKFLQQEKFTKDVQELGDQFVAPNGIFKPQYHQQLPMDGWCMYADSCWEQIENNKDLDLPTQQILVARFKTNEILNECLEQHFQTFNERIETKKMDKLALIDALRETKSSCLEDYDKLASHYNKKVYLENKEVLDDKIGDNFVPVIDGFMEQLGIKLLNNLTVSAKDPLREGSFIDRLTELQSGILEEYSITLSDFQSCNLLRSTEEGNERFKEFVELTVQDIKQQEIKYILKKIKKNLSFQIKDDTIALLSNPTESVWDHVMQKFNANIDVNLVKYRKDASEDSVGYDFQVGLTSEENDITYQQIRFFAWSILSNVVHDYLKPDTIVSILRDRFENKFRYDDNDSPIMWKNEAQIDESFRIAKEHALEVFNVLCIAKDSNNVEIVPDVDLAEGEDKYDVDSGVYHMERFAHLLNESEKEKVLKQFRRQINVSVIDSKRSIITATTHIPIWIYGLIVVLGWNEFMYVLRNPLYVSLLLMGFVGFFFLNKFGLWTPVLNVVQTAVGESRATIKSKLKEFVMEDDDIKKPVIQEPITPEDSMDEKSEKAMDSE
ncbi:dynamin-like GTPase SEY1 KNAG_0M01070 [Huiozyma naganishii CBS 8797]|uniref:GB1/RHD3-type G domain-containing protein n=1 Tax=Huiozyma naganishii (strain ATCC MYA-139 / BCRC 22969 / CBS 8797 / KCTC 17520 / NBRC 10181 / NCYC 3082 / Yp74L-3) TaxID=1071383 RepID=J7RDP2_HUIN7|nr:hypothetical protein KNAG_0M01070 [Kazachstania naganishii CBS 8797]CCK72960.1 hypothetical protein KNAG_0M01070 [Kazachstania naganishii CBS 8797]